MLVLLLLVVLLVLLVVVLVVVLLLAGGECVCVCVCACVLLASGLSCGTHAPQMDTSVEVSAGVANHATQPQKGHLKRLAANRYAAKGHI